MAGKCHRFLTPQAETKRMLATPDSNMKQVLWWICLLAAPLVLLTIELFHPANFTTSPGMYEFLSHAEHYDPKYQALGYFGPEWWFALHMIQTPMVGLVAVGLWLMVDDVGAADGGAAMVSAALARAAVFVFAVYFTVLDAIGGIGLGRTIVVVESLKLDDKQLDVVKMLLNKMWTDPLVGGVGSTISLTASWAAFVASVLVAASLLLSSRAGWVNMAVLVGFGWELQTSHAAPHGPIAFALLIVASGWL
jgi:hypothetical protein